MIPAPVASQAAAVHVQAFIAAMKAAAPVDFDEMCPGPLTGATEFFNVKLPDGRTIRLHGFCGGDAATTAIAISDQVLVTVEMEQATYHDWRAWSPASMNENGVTTMGGIIGYVGDHRKYPIVASHRYYASDVLATMDKYAGKYPVIIQGAQMQHLQNLLTGHGMNASHTTPLSHFMVCVGKNRGGWSARAKRVLSPGFWMADGDATDVALTGSQLVYYSRAELLAAGLDAWCVVGYRAKVPAPPSGGTPSGTGNGNGSGGSMALTLDEAGQLLATWFDVVTDPKNAGQKCLARKDNHTIVIRGGLLDAYLSEPARGKLAGFETLRLPTGNEGACKDSHGGDLPNAWQQTFDCGTLVSDRDHVFDRPAGVDGPYYHAKLAAPSAPPAPAPVPAPATSPLVQAALALATAWAGQNAAQIDYASAQARVNSAMGALAQLAKTQAA